MKFKQLLRTLREEKGITQRELADAIYVSRSAVAKWENGLGVPSRESYVALIAYFGVSEDELPLNEEERISYDSKRRTRYILLAILWILLLSLTIYAGWLTYALNHGYGFTADMAAGELWADNERIERPEYVFYYGTTVGELRVIDTFTVVEKRPIGYQRLYHDLKAMHARSLMKTAISTGICFPTKARMATITFSARPSIHIRANRGSICTFCPRW